MSKENKIKDKDKYKLKDKDQYKIKDIDRYKVKGKDKCKHKYNFWDKGITKRPVQPAQESFENNSMRAREGFHENQLHCPKEAGDARH